MGEDYYKELLRRYREGTCSEKEKQLVEQWYEHLGDGREKTNASREERETLKREAWKGFLLRREDFQQILEQQEEYGQFPFRRGILLWVAAGISVLLLAFGVAFYQKSSHQPMLGHELVSDELRIETAPKNGTRLLVLSDGSRVTLFAGSELQYGPDFDVNTRKVYLTGQAYFEVAENKEKPFLVYANSVITKVLGTSFLVKTLDSNNDVEILVTRGKVSVFKPESGPDTLGSESVILLPQQQVLYSASEDQLVQSEFVDTALVIPSAKPVSLVFENAPLPAILEAIQSSYNVRFQFDSETFRSCRITTSLEDETLGEILLIISSLLNADFETKGDTIFVEGKGCQDVRSVFSNQKDSE